MILDGGGRDHAVSPTSFSPGFRELLELAHHDIDRLIAEHEGLLRLLLTMLDRGHVKAVANVLRERLK